MCYEVQRVICDLLLVELEAGEAVIAEVGKTIYTRGAVEWPDREQSTLGSVSPILLNLTFRCCVAIAL